MDIRLKQLSYSSSLTLHSCPRKYELYKLNSNTSDIESDMSSSITFATGHTIGVGVGMVFLGHSEDEIIWQMFLTWYADLLDSNPKQHKSFWLCVIAIQKLIAMRASGFLSEWEVVTYEGKPAIELSFIIKFPDGFVYRGYVDCVLRNKSSGVIMVLECKTSSAYELSASSYKNSAQALGYSIVLDHIFPNLSSYKVQYLIYRTKHMLYEPMEFTKSFLARALWIKELMLEIEMIKLYDTVGVFPMHGESCREYGRDCEYFGICTMSNERLTQTLNEETESRILETHETFQISVSLADLIAAQLNKEVS